jgi:ankyrin repeat protein
MATNEILNRIAKGRTDAVLELFAAPNAKGVLTQGEVTALQWFVYYGDVTALKLAVEFLGGSANLQLDQELGNAAFMGHWRMCDYLLVLGANARFADPATGETALHSALSKAGRPFYLHTVRLLLLAGADPNAQTISGADTQAFMRDVRTKGETPLHRAAAFADVETIALLLEHGADKTIRDSDGDTPLSWASWHLRPGAVLRLLAHGPFSISDAHVAMSTSDHGAGWGTAMERNMHGEFQPESVKVP